MYFVYIVYSKDKDRFYTGFTDNVDRRIDEHRKRKKVKDFKLVHCEACSTRREARKLEKFFKSGFGREVRDELVKLWWA